MEKRYIIQHGKDYNQYLVGDTLEEITENKKSLNDDEPYKMFTIEMKESIHSINLKNIDFSNYWPVESRG